MGIPGEELNRGIFPVPRKGASFPLCARLMVANSIVGVNVGLEAVAEA